MKILKPNFFLSLTLSLTLSCGGGESVDTLADQELSVSDTDTVSSDDSYNEADDSFQLIDPNQYFDLMETGKDFAGFEMIEPEPPEKVTYFILTADSLYQSAVKFKEYREKSGKHVVYILKMSDIFPDDEDYTSIYFKVIHETIARIYEKRDNSRTFFVLLLGDSKGDKYPGHDYIPNASFGSVSTDNSYADIDNDGIPDMALGRIPVTSEADAQTVLEKIKKHESKYKAGVFNRQMHIYTGQGNFGEMIDALLENAVQMGLEKISYDFDMTMSYQKDDSPYYYVPFADHVVDLYNEGPLLTAYIGHGSEQGMEGLTTSQMDKIDSQNRLPFSAFFACYTGSFDDSGDSVSEKLLKKDGASVAIFASTDVSHPYGNALLGYEFERVLFELRPGTFGEVAMMSKNELINHTDDFREFIESVAAAILKENEIKDLKKSHLYLYNLIGDPATFLNLPQGHVELIITPDPALKGGSITVNGNVDNIKSGSVYVTLESERSTIYPKLNEIKDPEKEKELVQQNWKMANSKVMLENTVSVENSGFFVEFSLSDFEWTGIFYIKAYADDGIIDAMGSAGFSINNP